MNEIVKIHWIDPSFINCDGWNSILDVESYSTLKCLSIGIKIKEDKDAIYLIETYNMYKDIGCIRLIPRGCIKKTEILGKINLTDIFSDKKFLK